MTGQTVFLLIFSVLQVLDIWTTITALKMGCREANPILAKLFEKADPLAVLVPVKLLSVWTLWWADIYWLTAIFCAVYLYVVDNNLNVIKKAKEQK